MTLSRSIDHLVFAVRNLEKGKNLFEQLGFRAAPLGVHPFGTGNHNVFLSNSFIEILSVLNEQQIVPHQDGVFSFSAFNQDFLKEREGISMIVIQTEDALEDCNRLTAAGLNCSAPFHFSRDNQLADGRIEKVAFTTSFFQSSLLPGLAFFVCQHHHPEFIWQSVYLQHKNTAEGINAVDIVVESPEEQIPFFQLIFNTKSVYKITGGYQISTKNEVINLIESAYFKEKYSVSRCPETPFIGGVKLLIKSAESLQPILDTNKIQYQKKGNSFHINADQGLGVNWILSPM